MEDYLTYQEFLLSLDCAHHAYVKLLKENEVFDKEELLKEIEQLVVQDILKQIKGQKEYQLFS